MASIKLVNKSARILHIPTGGGESIAVPPTETGQGGVVLTLDDVEKEAFDKNIATPAVQAWIDADELVITEVEPEPEPHPTDDDEDDDDLVERDER
jgi:hypothetical protein